MLNVEVIDDIDAFEPLEKEWNALLDRYLHGNVFLKHQWLVNYWKAFGTGCKLKVILVREGERLVGAVPLILQTICWKKLPIRLLSFMTDPLSANVRSDFILPEEGEETVKALTAYLYETRLEWDVCILNAVSEESTLLSLYPRTFGASPLRALEPELYWVLHYLKVEGTWGDYLKVLPKGSRYDFLRGERILKLLGSPDINLSNDPEEVAEELENFFNLEARSLKQKKKDYTPLNDRTHTYYRTLFRALALMQSALVAVLRVNGNPTAAVVAVRYNQVLYILNTVFNPDFKAGNPGHVLWGNLIKHAREQGYKEVDFNGYGQHIQRWKTIGRQCYRISIFSPTVYGRFLYSTKHVLLPFIGRFMPGFLRKEVSRRGDRGIDPGWSEQP